MNKPEIHPREKEFLAGLQHTSPRDPQKAAESRANFVTEAESLRKPEKQALFARITEKLKSLQLGVIAE